MSKLAPTIIRFLEVLRIDGWRVVTPLSFPISSSHIYLENRVLALTFFFANISLSTNSMITFDFIPIKIREDFVNNKVCIDFFRFFNYLWDCFCFSFCSRSFVIPFYLILMAFIQKKIISAFQSTTHINFIVHLISSITFIFYFLLL